MYLFDLDFFGKSQYVIDASQFGNISRLYNHSCEPNMATYCVFSDSHDSTRHEIAFFSLGQIEAGEELTFDYAGWKSDISVRNDKQPEIKKDKCLCGARSCRGYVPLF